MRWDDANIKIEQQLRITLIVIALATDMSSCQCILCLLFDWKIYCIYSGVVLSHNGSIKNNKKDLEIRFISNFNIYLLFNTLIEILTQLQNEFDNIKIHTAQNSNAKPFRDNFYTTKAGDRNLIMQWESVSKNGSINYVVLNFSYYENKSKKFEYLII